MKFKVKWRLGIYEVNFKNKIKLECMFLYLKIKRIKRLFDRLFRDNIIAFFPLIILLSVISILIFYLKNYSNYYVNCDIIDIILDFKDIILTTYFLPIITSFIIKESNRKSKLKLQYEVYYNILCESQIFIENITKSKYDYYIFLCDENKNQFYKDYFNSNVDEYSSFNEFKYYCLKYEKNIKYQISKLGNPIGIIEYEKDTCNDISNCLNDLIFSVENKEKIYNKIFVNRIIEYNFINIYILVALYRKPWRWDLEIDQKLMKILKEKSKLIEGYDCTDLYKF